MKDLQVSTEGTPQTPTQQILLPIGNGKEVLTLLTSDNSVLYDIWRKRREQLFLEAPLSFTQLIILERLKPIGATATIEQFVEEQLGAVPQLTQPYMNRMLTEFETLVDYGYLLRTYFEYPRYALTRKGWFRRMFYVRGPYYNST